MEEADEHVKRCSFCRKNAASVHYLIAAPRCSICDECVVLSMRVLALNMIGALVENRCVPRTTLLGLLFSS